MYKFGVAVMLAAVVLGCESESEKAAKQVFAAQQALEAQQRAERLLFEKRRDELKRSPGAFLEAGGFNFHDKGIINSYRQLTSLTVTNKSALNVKLRRGRVTWLDANGNEVGSSPLTFKGTVASGAEGTFSTSAGTLTSGTIEGSADRARVEFTEIDVIETIQP